jgi:hypothetical protein
MIHGETSYLYDKNRKEQYHSFLKETASSSCYFSRYVHLYYDNKDRGDLSFFHRHLVECPTCQGLLRDVEKGYKKVVKDIPYIEADSYFKENLSSSLSDVFNILEQRSREEAQKVKGRKIKVIKKILVDCFVTPIFSRNFIYGVVLALVSFKLLCLVL